MFQELENVLSGHDSPPEELPLSVVAVSGDSAELLTRLKEAWAVIARWGRAYDDRDDDDEWPSNEDCYRQLPDWLRRSWLGPDDPLFENWLCDLDERTWVWWDAEALQDLVKVDLSSSALPCSTLALRLVIEAAGGEVIYADRWIPDAAARLLRSGAG
jgi:hypothetical protein